MKLTKCEHACLVIEFGSSRLVIDPGVYAKSLTDLNDIRAVVITHIHPDHFDKDKVSAIIAQNPSVKVLAAADVAAEIGSAAQAVKAGDTAEADGLKFEFFGGDHALIHESIPLAQNIGVLVNDRLYYGGDSFVQPGKPVEVLAVPVNAPWMKMAEAMDYLADIKPQLAFPTHNGFLNDEGNSLADRLLGFCESFGTRYQHLKPGDSIDLAGAA